MALVCYEDRKAALCDQLKRDNLWEYGKEGNVVIIFLFYSVDTLWGCRLSAGVGYMCKNTVTRNELKKKKEYYQFAVGENITVEKQLEQWLSSAQLQRNLHQLQ